MYWMSNNSDLLIVVLLIVALILLAALIAHVRTLIEATTYIGKLYESSSPIKTSELIYEIKERVENISSRLDRIEYNTSD